ncbi:hypothetical protein ACU5AX_08995 [Sphingomonas sp. XXL09]|uniref:hypothetical protein n=1 Tax=Sphingomonas sp. XXL09 TaxID=3457787 RepID=UPI00406B9FC7
MLAAQTVFSPFPAAAGYYARHAQLIWDKVAGSPVGVRLVSPDGRSRVLARYDERQGEDGEVTLRIRGAIGAGEVSLGAGVGSELLWSPTSRAFAVTTSDGGANGPFRVLIVAGDRRRLRTVDLAPLVHAAFGQPTLCGWPERPNVAVIRWRSETRLIIVAEIVAHSDCDSFGTFVAYDVDWRARRILRTFDQITAKRLFGRALGVELRSAPDGCIRRPRRCWVSTNHDERMTR